MKFKLYLLLCPEHVVLTVCEEPVMVMPVLKSRMTTLLVIAALRTFCKLLESYRGARGLYPTLL